MERETAAKGTTGSKSCLICGLALTLAWEFGQVVRRPPSPDSIVEPNKTRASPVTGFWVWRALDDGCCRSLLVCEEIEEAEAMSGRRRHESPDRNVASVHMHEADT